MTSPSMWLVLHKILTLPLGTRGYQHEVLLYRFNEYVLINSNMNDRDDASFQSKGTNESDSREYFDLARLCQ